MTRPELAIVIPAYNEEGYVAGTLDALYSQRRRGDILHVVVDNGSTDGTREEITAFQKEHEDFPLEVIEEPEKGTGRAADTGVRYAIEHGAPIVARTDADTEPRDGWTTAIEKRMADEALQLIGGWVHPKRDRHYRFGDDILMPMAALSAPKVIALSRFNPVYSKVAVGGNMATRSSAYEAVGGFPRQAIEDIDDDVEYSVRVRRQFGSQAIGIYRDMAVETSMRRIRKVGLLNMALHHLSLPGKRSAKHTVDVR